MLRYKSCLMRRRSSEEDDDMEMNSSPTHSHPNPTSLDMLGKARVQGRGLD